MRILLSGCVGVLLLFTCNTAFGQAGADTLGLTGTMADTMTANRLFGEMKSLIKERKWEDAVFKGEQARAIYERCLGEACWQIADVWHQIGLIRYYDMEYVKAIETWEKSLQIREKIYGTAHPSVAVIYNSLGVVYESKGEYEKALEYHQKALDIRINTLGEKDLDVAGSYTNIGVVHFDKGQYAIAIEYYQKSLGIRIEILGPEHLDVAKSYNNIANALNAKGEYNNAIIYYKKALEIRIKLLGANHSDVAAIYNNMGVLYDSKGEYNQAIESFHRALSIRLKVYGAMHIFMAQSYYNLANAYNEKGDYQNAILYHKRALSIHQKVLGLDHPTTASSYNSLGNACNNMGDYGKALEYYQEALRIRLKKLGADHPDVASSYNNLGNTFFYKNEFVESKYYYQKALDVYIRAFGNEHVDVAKSYNNLSVLLDETGAYDQALNFKQKALEIRLKLLGADHPDVGSSYDGLASLYNSMGEYQKAIGYYKKSCKIWINSLGKEHSDVAMSYNNLGYMYTCIEMYDSAIIYYHNALLASKYDINNLSTMNSVKEPLNTLKKLGFTLRKQYLETRDTHLLSKIYDYTKQALDIVAFQQNTFMEASTKSFWQTKNYPIYEQAINISLLKASIGHNDSLRQNTFTYAEKSKASLLQAQIREASAFSGLPDSLLQKEHDLRIDITWREKQRQALLDKGLTETDTNTLRISGILFDLKNSYQALKKRFETEYTQYYRLKYDLSTVSLRYVQDTLLQPEQVLLEYFVGDSSIYLFVVRPDTMIVREVKRDFPLDDWIEQFRHGLYGYYTAPKSEQTGALYEQCMGQYLEYAPKLYEKLFAPVQAFLPEQVILVPDGPLGYVPFDALLTAAPKDPNDFKNYPYLLHKHQISYTYSATLLREMRDKKHRHEPAKEFVAFAPFYNGDTTLLASMYNYDDLMRKDLQPLAYSGPEVAAASKMMHGEIVAGTAATEERFTRMAGDYRMIHLATHGRADNRAGDYAFLAFTEIKDSIENELLYVKDLYNLELNADLVVLSACETGIGKLQRGEGIISLARAFAYAGAKSIVTTLWEVNDRSTSELMRYFYRELQRGKTKDEALRLARKRYFNEQSVRVCHPFFWAAFVPVGDMRALR